MKAGVAMTFDDLARTLRALAHDLADQAEAGYRPSVRPSGDFRRVDGLTAETALERGVSHDGAGR
jgi:hypothetical protein